MKPPRLPHANCNACPLSRYRNNGPAGYEGPDNPEVIFIGEGLGAEEAQAKRPFVGASGKILRGVADRYGKGRYGITNIVACRPPNNDTPDHATISACALRLKAELDRFPNAKLVALGEVAVQALGVPHRLNEIDGCWSKSMTSGRWVMSSYHPSKVMRETHSKTGNAARFPSFALAVRRSFEEPKELCTPTVPYTIISDASQLPDKEGMVVVDIETEGLDRWDRMTCLVLSWGPGKTYIVERDVIYSPEFKTWFNDRAGVAGHNLQFDLHRLCLQLGVTLPENIFDTMKAYHLINESGLVAFPSKDFKEKKTKATFGLKTMLQRIFGIKYGFEGDWKVNLQDEDQRKQLYDYAAIDGEYTYRLKEWLLEEMDETLLKLAYTIPFPMNAVLTDMELGGVLFDKETAGENGEHFDAQVKVCKPKEEGVDGERVKEIRTLLQSEFPTENFAAFNPQSTQHVAHVLFDLYKFPVQMRYDSKKKTKVITTNADALKTLSTIDSTNPFLPLMLNFRPTAKLNSTYVKSPLKKLDAEGYIHASFWGLTETGRLSCNDPNLQNIPRGQTEDAKRIKMQYLPDQGHVFIEFDWSQAELRTLALFAQISAMITAFREGRDLHTEMTVKIFGPEYNTWDKARRELWRSIVKRINFGIPYGSEAKTVADVVWKEFSVRDRMAYPGGYPALLRLAEEIYAGWFKANPEYTIWSERVLAEAFAKGYLETPFGRRRRIGFKPPTWGRPTPELIHLQNQLKNFLIQSVGSADMNSLGMIRCRDRIKREGWRSLARLVLTVHDSVGFSASKDPAFLAEFIPAMRDEMLSVPVEYLGTEVPFKVDVKVGERWGSTKEIAA